MILERLTQQVRPDKWDELHAIDKEYDVVEGRLGFPKKKRYQAMFGADISDTLIIEREWESLTQMEAAYMPLMADPEFERLNHKIAGIVVSNRQELFWVFP